MARTTPELIAKIAEVNPDIDLDDFILMAEELVTEVCEPAGYTEARLELIERNLAAYFYHALIDMKADYESVRGIGERLQSKVDLGFDLNHYGQTAMRLDTAGGLAALNQQATSSQQRPRGRIRIKHLGTPPEDSIL